MTNVVSREFKSQLSKISSEVMILKKKLWKEDRKTYNKIKKDLVVFEQDVKEVARYYVMQDPEVSFHRANTLVNRTTRLIDNMLIQPIDNIEVIELLEKAKKDTESLMVFLKLDEGEKSFY